MRKFKDVVEFTNWLVGQPGTVNKTITLRAVYKIDEVTVQPAKDQNGNWLGVKSNDMISREDKESGRYIPTENSLRKIKEGTTFDLNKPKDKADWMWVMYSRYITLDKDETYKRRGTYFFIDLPDYQAQKKVSVHKLRKKALDIIEDMPTLEYADFISMMGQNTDYMSDHQLEEFLYDRAYEKDGNGARKIIRVYENPDFQYELTFRKARKKGVIHKIDGYWRFEEHDLGYTEADVIRFFKDPAMTSVVNSIVINTEGGDQLRAMEVIAEKKKAQLEDEELLKKPAPKKRGPKPKVTN